MKKIFSALLAAAVVGTLSSAYADDSAQEYNLSIARQPLRAVLIEFSRQTGLGTALVNKNNDRDIVVGPLSGRYTAAEALSVLLDNTGLTFTQMDNFSFSVTAKQGANAVDSRRMTTEASLPKLQRLAESRLLADGKYREADASETPGIRVAASAPQEGAPRQESSQDGTLIDEMLVVGSHIRGIQNHTVPLTVLDQQYIQSTGITTTTRLVETLPQNFAFDSQSITGISGSVDPGPQASSIQLRGLGEGTTLILLNGRRMAPGYRSTTVDISALPLSAIDRVEVLTDGASARYGADAIAGVVNFVLKDDFEGAQTSIKGGWADGTNEYRIAQVLGNSWETGNALLSLDYYRRDLLKAADRDFVNPPQLGSLLPEDKTYSALFSAGQKLGDRVTLFSNALYTQRDSHNFAGRSPTVFRRTEWDNPQVTATAGVGWDVAGDWRVEAAGTYSRNKMTGIVETTIIGGAPSTLYYNTLFTIRGAQVKADGTLFELPGGSVRAAIGAEWRSEAYEDLLELPTAAFTLSNAHSKQIIRSAFAEVYVPVVGANNSLPGIRRLELSLAGRFDDYSTFDSSADPQLGIMWEPIEGLRLRAGGGTSYKAPDLGDRSYTGNGAIAAFGPDPGLGTDSYRLYVFGTNVEELSAQESRNLSLGLEFAPPALEGFTLGLNYYRIEFTDRIAAPTFAESMLADPIFNESIYFRDPSVALVSDYVSLANRGTGVDNFTGTTFTPDLIDVIVDQMQRNMSVVKTKGWDASLQYSANTSLGLVRLSLVGTHISERSEQITSSSPSIETVDTLYNPPDWRARAALGLQRNGWSGNLFVNYTDSYTDKRRAVPASVSSFTTIDTSLIYDVGNRVASGLLSGVSVSLSVQNLLDKDPPHVAVIVPNTFASQMGFDPTNASPLGRLISLEISKAW